MTCYYRAVDTHSMLVLHLEILYGKKKITYSFSFFFFSWGKAQYSRKIFFLQEIERFVHYQANSTPLPLGPLPELFTHRLVQANHLGFLLLHTIWYYMSLKLLWIKRCFTVTSLCSVEESRTHSPIRKGDPCLLRKVDKQDTAAWIQGTHRERCWEEELAMSFSLFW